MRKLRQQLEPVTSNIGSENDRTYTDKHGNTATMRTANIGCSRAPVPEKGSSEQEPAQPQLALPPQESPEPAPEPLRPNNSNLELPAPESAAKEPMGSDDDDARASRDLEPEQTADVAPPVASIDPASPPDPWADQRVAVSGCVRGLANIQDVDFGSVADAMPIDELLEARDDGEKAALIIEKWREAVDKAIESAAGARDK